MKNPEDFSSLIQNSIHRKALIEHFFPSLVAAQPTTPIGEKSNSDSKKSSQTATKIEDIEKLDVDGVVLLLTKWGLPQAEQKIRENEVNGALVKKSK